MRLLAMDTSTWSLAVGIVEDGELLGELNTHLPKNHSLRLMPAIKQLFKHVDLSPQNLDGIAVAYGPGSYTGVRIGVTTAKTMAWSLQVPLLGLSSLQVLAQNVHLSPGLIIPMFDARRQQVYTGMYAYHREKQSVVSVKEDRIQLAREWLQELSLKSLLAEEPLLFMGNGAHAFREQIIDFFPEQAHFALPHEHIPRGGQLAYLAWRMWEEGKVEDVHKINPHYLQLAEVEQKLAQGVSQSDIT